MQKVDKEITLVMWTLISTICPEVESYALDWLFGEETMADPALAIP